MTQHIGIDPGLRGHIATIYACSAGIVADSLQIIPLHGLGNLDAIAEALIAAGVRDAVTVTIEEVSSAGTHTGGKGKRAMGAASAFTFGRGYGELRGLVLGLRGSPASIIRPQDWRRAALVPVGSGKPGSLARAKDLWPEIDWTLTGYGERAGFDAALIAHAGKRIRDLTRR